MASLRFNKKIYSRAAVEQAAEVYGELARITHRSHGNYHEVELSAISPENGAVSDTLTREFTNYVLYATLLGRRT